MKKIPLTTDLLHSTIDYNKLIKLQSEGLCSIKKTENVKDKCLTKKPKIYRGGKR